MLRHGVKISQEKDHKCLMCHEVCIDKNSFKKKKAQHQKELDVITLDHVCKECSLSYGSREDLLEHMLEKHRPKEWKGVNRLSNAQELKECENGPKCRWLKNNKCKFEHNIQPWKTGQTKSHQKKLNQQKPPKKTQHKNTHQTSHDHKQYFPPKGKPVCDNGPSCKYLKEDRCKFVHKESKHQGKQQRQETSITAHQQGAGTIKLKQCKFGKQV